MRDRGEKLGPKNPPLLLKLNDPGDVCADSEDLGALGNGLSLDLNVPPWVLQFEYRQINVLKFALRRSQIVPKIKAAEGACLRAALAVAPLALPSTTPILALLGWLVEALYPVLQSEPSRLNLPGNRLHFSIRKGNFVLVHVHNYDTVRHHLYSIPERSLSSLYLNYLSSLTFLSASMDCTKPSVRSYLRFWMKIMTMKKTKLSLSKSSYCDRFLT